MHPAHKDGPHCCAEFQVQKTEPGKGAQLKHQQEQLSIFLPNGRSMQNHLYAYEKILVIAPDTLLATHRVPVEPDARMHGL
jgi:hypothetical protein